MTDIRMRLDLVEIESPCALSWEALEGGEKRRFCRACRHDVIDVAALTHDEAGSLLKTAQGRLCLRVTRWRDGTVVVAGRTAWKRFCRRWANRLYSILAFFGIGAGLLGLLGCCPVVMGRMRVPPPHGPDTPYLAPETPPGDESGRRRYRTIPG